MLKNILFKKQWKLILSIVRKILWSKILGSEELNKRDSCLYQIVLFAAIKNQASLEINKKK